MSVEDRLAEIERRLAALESQSSSRAERNTSAPPPPRAAQRPFVPPPPPPPPPSDEMFSEKWMGQRGLLAVGVLLVLLAAGYLLKLAFDRGWISPAFRCVGGVIAGLAIAGIGGRIRQRGLKQYGASLIGLGFGVVYLSLWAASSLYQLVPPTVDMAALTLVSLALAGVAYVIDVEALCAAAAAGAFLAPILISTQRNPDGFLIYLALVGATLGGAAASKHWRYATFIVAASVFGLGTGAAADPLVSPNRVFLYSLFAGSAGLYVGLREGWPETRFLAFSGGWALLAYADRLSAPWLIAVGGIVLAAPVWWRAFSSPTIWPDPVGRGTGIGKWSGGETFYFYMTSLLLVWASGHGAPVWFRGHPGGAFLVVGIAYAVPGLSSPRIPFATAAAALLAAAAIAQWNDVYAVWALLIMSLAWGSLDHAMDRTDGRWYALVLGATAVLHLLVVDLAARSFNTPAFLDSWAVSLWLCIATAAALASRPWRQATVLWTTAGVLLLFGVTGELLRFFRQSSLSPTTADLASGLSVSAWWTIFAGGLVGLGFVRDLKQVRKAGLAVAGLAVAKVLLFDLSTLDALYRVGSVFILGLVSLVLAYWYHRHEKSKA